VTSDRAGSGGAAAEPLHRAVPGAGAAGTSDGAEPGAAVAVEHRHLDLDEAVREVEALEHENRPPAAGPVGNAVTALVVIAVGAVAFAGSLSLGVGSAEEPGPGTWPLIVSAVLTLLGVALLANSRRIHDAERFSGTSLLVVGGLVTMVVFVAVIEVVGFEIPAALLCFVWLRFLGRESWRLSAITSVAVVAGFYLVFVAALAVPIPHLF
jgi:hypothetical protein